MCCICVNRSALYIFSIYVESLRKTLWTTVGTKGGSMVLALKVGLGWFMRKWLYSFSHMYREMCILYARAHSTCGYTRDKQWYYIQINKWFSLFHNDDAAQASMRQRSVVCAHAGRTFIKLWRPTCGVETKPEKKKCFR